MTSTVFFGIAELVTNDELLDGADHSQHLGRLNDAAVVVQDGLIAWVGPAAQAPPADDRQDVGGRAVIPGFVDSHSHLVFAGDRSAEFAARMTGVPYDGGGIAASVNATRAASDEELRALVGARVRRDARPRDDHGRDQERVRTQRRRRGTISAHRGRVHF